MPAAQAARVPDRSSASPSRVDLAGRRRLRAEQGPADVLATGAVHADDADDLARVDVEVDVAERRAGQAAYDEPRAGRLVGRLGQVAVVVVVGAGRADHHPVQLGRGGARGGHLPHRLAAAEHAHAVADVEHLVEAVRDEDDRGELAQPADLGEEGLDLLRLQHRGGLVEDDDRRVGRALLDAEHLGDLDHLPLGEGQRVGAGQRVDVGADLVELLLGEASHGVPAVDAAAYAPTLAAEDDVLRGGEVGDERLLLEDHADAVVGGVDDAAQADLLAAHPDLAGVGADQADQRLEQGGLAGTVLAGEAEHLVLADDQVDAVERLDARVVLDEAADLEGVDLAGRRCGHRREVTWSPGSYDVGEGRRRRRPRRR